MLTEDVRRLGDELGLDAVGVARAEAYTETERHIRERRARGLFADMRFTMARPEESCHPESLLPGARSVVSAALCYWQPEAPLAPGEGRLPRYTWDDAYAALREKLDAIGRRLGGEYRVLVDANQHVDREAAARSGVGFYGKNTMLITRRHGSWVVLGTLVTDRELEPTPPLDADCGSCTLCIEACPTHALDEPGTLDATRCLSYWTQAPAAIPEDYRAELGAQVYGCDICQDVCPWNRGVEKRRAGRAASAPATSTSSPGSKPTAARWSTTYDRLYVPRNDAALAAAERCGCARERRHDEHVAARSNAPPPATTSWSPSTRAGRSSGSLVAAEPGAVPAPDVGLREVRSTEPPVDPEHVDAVGVAAQDAFPQRGQLELVAALDESPRAPTASGRTRCRRGIALPRAVASRRTLRSVCEPRRRSPRAPIVLCA